MTDGCGPIPRCSSLACPVPDPPQSPSSPHSSPSVQWMDMVDATRSVDWTKPRDALRGLSNLSTAVYYLADNAAFLTKLKFASVDETAATKLAMMTFWFGQLFALVGEVMDFQANLAEEKAVRADAGGDKSKLDKDKLRKILTDRFWLVNSFVVRVSEQSVRRRAEALSGEGGGGRGVLSVAGVGAPHSRRCL